MTISIAVLGSTGKMGKKILELARSDPEFSVTGAHSRQQPDLEVISKCDVAIDFSSPLATLEHLASALLAGKPLVLGTTGHSPEEKRSIEEAAKKIPILYSANFSFGIALCLETAARFAKTLGDAWNIEIVETHHAHKKDSPSGTAHAFLNAIGQTVTVRSFRVGEVIGDHTIIFESNKERIELKHVAKSRDIFAQGALIGAKFLVRQTPGLYSLNDLIFQ